MKAPNHERAELLREAITVASDAMDAPINRIKVTSRYVRCWSKAGLVILEYGYSQGGITDPVSGSFHASPGSGTWWVRLADDGPKRSFFAQLWAYMH